MKFLVLSDLHLEHGVSYRVPEGVDYDAVILAGDIQSPGTKGVAWAQRDSTFSGKPVVVVPGNHEFYRGQFEKELVSMRAAAAGSNVHVLHRDAVDLGGVRIAGCTLWTDFRLPVGGDGDVNVSRALAEANHRLNDFRLIEVDAGVRTSFRTRDLRRPLRAEDTLAWHAVERDWLRRELSQVAPDVPVVVVTHHAPSRRSVAAKYRGDWLSPGFASELEEEMFGGVQLWIHGHTHSGADYLVNQCRVVANPRGYRLVDGSFEHAHFNSALVIDVPVPAPTPGMPSGLLRRLAGPPSVPSAYPWKD